MGFRAPNLLAAARQITDGKFDLEKIRTLDYLEARAELMKLRGVGGKIADCVLLCLPTDLIHRFLIDVWIERALQKLYFPRRRASGKTPAPFRRDSFRPARRFRAAISFSLHPHKIKLIICACKIC